LHAAAAPVNEPHPVESRGRRGLDVFVDNRRNIARREGMQIDLAIDRKAHDFVRHVRTPANTTVSP